jgi:hypothetical protein
VLPPLPKHNKQATSNVANLVRVHDRLLKLEARVDLLLKRHSSEVDEAAGGGAASAAAAAAAAGHAKDEVAALTASAQERDIRWRVRDAVEDTFAAGWEARRGGAAGRAPAAASPRVAPPETPPKPAAAAAVPPAVATLPPAPKTTTTAVNVEFVVRCPFTAYGERVWLCGGAPALGKWKPKSALRLRWGEGGRWRAVAQFEVGRDQEEDDMEFKALLRRDDDATDKGGRWEALERNRKLGLFANGDAADGQVQARTSEGIRTSVLEDGTVRVEFDAGF